MPVKLKLWILALAFLGVVVPNLFGDEALLKGGEGQGGVVNLPGGRARTGSGMRSLASTVRGGGHQTGIKMLQIENGLTLVTPTNMSPAIVALLSQHRIPIALQVTAGRVRIAGAVLHELQTNGITGFEMIFASVDGRWVLNVCVELPPNGSDFSVFWY